MAELFQTFIYQPILSALVFIYSTVAFHNLGVAIILLTILMRLILLPIFWKSAKDQALLQRLQPHVKKIQLDHKGNREAQGRALLELYRTHKVNPMTGFLLILLQLPVFFALFQIFTRELGGGVFDSRMLFGLVSLEERNIVLALIAGALQYLQGKMMTPPPSLGPSPIASTGKIMLFVGPLLTIFVLMNLPAALGVYWSVSTIFSIVQQYFINRNLPKLENA